MSYDEIDKLRFKNFHYFGSFLLHPLSVDKSLSSLYAKIIQHSCSGQQELGCFCLEMVSRSEELNNVEPAVWKFLEERVLNCLRYSNEQSIGVILVGKGQTYSYEPTYITDQDARNGATLKRCSTRTD
ncbi:hypothetical protein RF11_00909 [Thelohanellus kitauei]|uniref:Uncharacterized protein n=1 Tax=Thelohanellus kitauei TaxID=669202 RepID=A0A0C2J8Y8_THEKT|nr:hypothetical protein RF11_00909 [Thelohanellus kitauei]